jgi:pyruvate,water dikinase
MFLALENASDTQLVGGKAAALGGMLRAGFTVPDGIVLPTSHFADFLDASGRRESIESLCESVDVESPKATAEVSATIVSWLQDTPLSDELATALTSHFRRQNAASLAVRSSAVGEDSARASFAGQLDSFLDITDEAALLAAVKRCWCSYYSARGLAYQRATGVELKSMAVIVQTQIVGAVSGVAFTVAPHDPDSLLVEYCEGSCEDLVSGRVVPKSLTVDRLHKAGHAAAPLLDGAQIDTLIASFIRLEKAFGGPQDIEWTLDPAGELHILQSRPITTAQPVGERVVYSNANINENYPGPVTPFLQSLAQTSYAHYFRNLAIAYGFAPRRIQAMEDALCNIVGVHGQRLYYDVSNIHAVFRMAPWGTVFAQWFNDFVGVEEKTDARDRDVTWERSTSGKASEALELMTIAVNVFQQYRTMTPQVERFEETVAEFARRCAPARLRTLGKDELIDLLDGFMDIRTQKWLGATLADSACMVCCGALDAFLGKFFNEPSDVLLHGLLRGLPGIVSSEPPKQLWKLSRTIREDADLMALFENDTPHILETLGWNGESMTSSHRFAKLLQAFLDDWGFRCTGELMMTTSSFQEQPEAVVDMLRSYRTMSEQGPDDVIEQQAALRLKQTAELSSQLSPVAQKIFVTLLSATGASLALRERARLKQALLYRCCRRIVLALGAELVRLGALKHEDDVLFMSWQELVALRKDGEVPTAIAQRRARFVEESAWPPPPPRIIMRRGQTWSPPVGGSAEVPEESDGRLTGIAAAAGTVKARATVARGQEDFHRVQSGDILVAPQTDPGWATVLFLVRGLVMERGGMLSHGAIIAREFGIPSVVGVERATERIPNGSTVLVDGDRGWVQIHE